MSATDRNFLLALAAVLVLMAALVLAPDGQSEGGPATAIQGEPRQVDVDLLRRRLIRGELSEKEAMYYHRADEYGR